MTKLNECYYCIDIQLTEDNGISIFCITPKEVFEEHGRLDDCFCDIDDLPLEFENWMESTWGYYGPINDGAMTLQAAGCEYSEKMDRYINGKK